jgi:hypothetical protein
MPRLTDEERLALPLYEGSWWQQVADRWVVVDGMEDRIEITHVSVLTCKPKNNTPYRAYVQDALAVITASGLNPWYHEAQRLRAEVAQLKRDMADRVRDVDFEL